MARVLLHLGKSTGSRVPYAGELIGFRLAAWLPSWKSNNMRAAGVDDAKTTRTPSAWMILLAVLARWQILF